jgi:acetolactate synthase-1/2/3 large subunit
VILAAYQEIDIQRTLWNGQPYDQASIVRNSVKHDRRLKGDEDLHEAFSEAFRIACSEPTGPVYLCFPMRYLYSEVIKPAGLPTVSPATPLPAVDAEILEKMADILLDAKKPLLVSGNAGRYTQNVESLIDLAETLSASVLTGYSWMNFPSNHPLCVGIEQIGGSRKKDAGYDEADVILAIDYAMPYVGSAPPPNPEAKILHIDVDPLTQGRLLWGRGADVFMKADAREAIPSLIKLLKTRITASKQAELDERSRRIAVRNEKAREGWYKAAREQSAQEPISADYLCYCLNQVIDEDTIVINHTLSHCASATEQIVRTKPGTWFGCPSGAIGWAPGAALGAASASPGRTVVAVMTDGGFVWGCPTSTFWTSSSYGFPFLAIICNNGGYGEIRNGQQRMTGGSYPSGQFAAESAVDFQPNYAMIAQGAGALGRKVTKPEEVLPALREALDAVRSGKPAVLDIHLPRER